MKTLARLRFSCSSSDVNRTSRPVERTGSAETILKEAHLASYPLVMLYLGSPNPLGNGGAWFKPVTSASDELRRAAGG